MSTKVSNPQAVAKALTFFKWSAIAAGIAMFILIAEMVLKYAFSNDVLSWWSPVHGLIFMVLVAATTNLGFKVGWSLWRIGLILLGSCIPFVAFILEQRVAREIEPLIADSVAA